MIFNTLDSNIEHHLSNVNISVLEVAKCVHFLNWFHLLPVEYKDIYNYCELRHNINRKTANFYINVIDRFFYYDRTIKFDENIDFLKFYFVKEGFKDFSFSQLKSLLGLSDDEINELSIDSSFSCRTIEKLRKEHEIEKNKVLNDFSEKQKVVNHHKNIDVDNISVIPDDSEYEFIFKKSGSLKKGSKRCYNLYTVIQMVRKYIETNDESEFYFGLVKIPRGLT